MEGCQEQVPPYQTISNSGARARGRIPSALRVVDGLLAYTAETAAPQPYINTLFVVCMATRQNTRSVSVSKVFTADGTLCVVRSCPHRCGAVCVYEVSTTRRWHIGICGSGATTPKGAEVVVQSHIELCQTLLPAPYGFCSTCFNACHVLCKPIRGSSACIRGCTCRTRDGVECGNLGGGLGTWLRNIGLLPIIVRHIAAGHCGNWHNSRGRLMRTAAATGSC